MSNAASFCNSVVASLEKHLDTSTMMAVLGECGRACARDSGVVENIRSLNRCASTVDELYDTLHGTLGDLVVFEDDQLLFVYPQCFCKLIEDRLQTTPHSHCFCSVGWVKEVCEAAIESPVVVELIESVIRGGSKCKFRVHLGG